VKSLFHWLRSLKPATDYIVVAPEGFDEVMPGIETWPPEEAARRGLWRQYLAAKKRAEGAERRPSTPPGPASPSGADEAEEG
jgi:hypothetical protein